MENTQEVVTEVAVAGKRGRPTKMTKEKVEALLATATSAGRTLKAVCAERHIPYITVVVARKRYNLQEKDLKVVEPVAA
jgi:hypothetical protein